MNCPPLRARTFGSDADGASGVSAFELSPGVIWANGDHAGPVGKMGEIIYRLDRTTPAA